ncbi:MAG: hypothetical protein IPK35_22535 [Saprospiraceae bacterium]|jgi:hypothetical protein|nr:hypothetical protein [Saprospiraceae bacterium]
MIYQLPINLEIHNKTVQAIIDLETGFLGFSEELNNETIEYYFGESPIEFRKALFDKLEHLIAKKSLVNFKICRKAEKMKVVQNIISKN